MATERIDSPSMALGSHSLNTIVGIALLAALLSFVPEIWKKYA